MGVLIGACITCGNTGDMLGSDDMNVGQVFKSIEPCYEMKDFSGGDPECPGRKFRIVHKRK